MKKLVISTLLLSATFCANAQFSGILKDLKTLGDSIKQQQAPQATQPQQSPQASQQQQTPQPPQVKQQDSAVTQKASASLAGQSNTKQADAISINKSDAPLTAPVFNLKGFHLNMTRDDVKKIIPNSKPQVADTIEGKEWSGFNCGVIVQQSPSGCNFTYAGEEITAITVHFWGDRAFKIQFYFGAYRPNEHNVAGADLARKMRAALDAKYPKESNSTGPNGNIGTLWESGSEHLTTEYVEDRNFKSNSISLVDIKYWTQLKSATARHQEAKQKIDKAKSDKKLLSDM